MPVLMSAVSSADSPGTFSTSSPCSRAATFDQLDNWPDLATALFVVWDKSPATDGTGFRPKFATDRPVRLFSYFTDPRTPLRFNLHQLAWQLDVYIVDLKVTEDEMHRATQKYLNNYSIASAYFDITDTCVRRPSI